MRDRIAERLEELRQEAIEVAEAAKRKDKLPREQRIAKWQDDMMWKHINFQKEWLSRAIPNVREAEEFVQNELRERIRDGDF